MKQLSAKIKKYDKKSINNVGNSSLLRSGMIVTMLSLVSLVTGFLLQMVLASNFGTKAEMDAYWAASSVPTILNTVLIGALSITFVPIFIEYRVRALEIHQTEHELWHIFSTFFNGLALILLLIISVSMIFAPWLVQILVPGFANDTEIFELTVILLRMLLPTIFFTGMAAFLASIHNAQRHFVLPASLPLINSLFILIITYLFSSIWGIKAVALGSLVGGIMQLIVMLPILFGKYSLYLDWHHEAVNKALRLILPWMLAAIISKANPIIDRYIASNFGEGSISYLGYAYSLLLVSTTLISKGISIVIFPSLSENVTNKEWTQLKQNMRWGIRMIMLLALPMMIIVLLFREPIIRLLFEHGRFTSEATVATGWAWVAYLGAFVATSIGTVIAYTYYAMQDTITMMKIGLLGFCLNIIMAFGLQNWLGYLSPALAYSCAASFNLVILTLIIFHRLKIKWSYSHFKQFIKPILATGITLIITTVGMLLLAFWWQPVTFWQDTLYLIFWITILLFTYFVLLMLFKVEEAKVVFMLMSRKILERLHGLLKPIVKK